MKINHQSTDPLLNTQQLLRVWDAKYASRNETNQVFTGNVEGYEYKRINNSEYMILKNPSRITKKVNKIGNPTQLASNQSTKSKPARPETVFIELKEEHFCFQKIMPQQVLTYLNQDMQFVHVEEGQHLLFRNEQYKISQHPIIHAIIVNKVPICPYHCLFVPWINGRKVQVQEKTIHKKLEQRMIVEALPLALNLLDMYQDLVVGFNSVGAAASVNNLHFQMFFKQSWIGENQIPIVKLLQNKTTERYQLISQKSITIESFSTQQIDGFIVSLPQTYGAYQLQLTYTILSTLIDKNIPHNMMFIKKKSHKEILIFVRNFENERTKFGCMEFSGVFCLDFDGTTKEEIEEKYGEMRLQEGVFEDLEKRLMKELTYEVMLNSSHES